jgi:hypothetical protein
MSTAKKQEPKHLTLVHSLPENSASTDASAPSLGQNPEQGPGPGPSPSSTPEVEVPIAEVITLPLPWKARFHATMTEFWASYSDNFFAFGMALFAAILAVGEMLFSRYGSDNMIMVNEKNNMYMWYQSKGIKENITEGRIDFLHGMIESGTVGPKVRTLFSTQIASMDKEIARYKREKKEILLGSKAVGEKGWTQEIDGKCRFLMLVNHFNGRSRKDFIPNGDL